MSFNDDIDNLVIKFNELLGEALHNLERRQTHLKNSSRYMAPEYKIKTDDIESELTYNIKHYQYILDLLSNMKKGQALQLNDFYYLEPINIMQDFMATHRENIFVTMPARRKSI